MVSSVDAAPGAVNVLMVKKAMEMMKQQASIVTETLARQEAAAPAQTAMTPNLGTRIDLRM